MKRFINDDVKLRKGGRKGVYLSEKQLFDKINKYGWFDDECDFEMLLEALKSDKKYMFDSENVTYDPNEIFGDSIKGTPLVGYQCLENGFSFLGCQAGGDWEYPIFFIIYWDGKKLRMYIPSYGNCINLDWNCALGSEEEYTDIYTAKLEKKYKTLGIWDMDETWQNMYLKKYELSDSSIGYQWDAIKEDISNRIEIV